MAPTWPWSSISLGNGGYVTYNYISQRLCEDFDKHHRFRSKHISVIDVKCNFLTNNPFGWLANGRLTVRGLLGSARGLMTDESKTRFLDDRRFAFDFEDGVGLKVRCLHIMDSIPGKFPETISNY